MKSKIYTPEQVLMAVVEFYANHDCNDLDESVEAFFIDDDGTVEIEITSDKEPANDTVLPFKKKPKKNMN